MSTAAPDLTLGDLAVRHPESVRVLEALKLDYCCGGDRTLADACEQAGLKPDAVLAMVQAAGRSDTSAAHAVPQDTIAQLCEHIVERHHQPLRAEMQRIAALLDTVVRVHGRERPGFAQATQTFARLRDALTGHMAEEERELFPACIAGTADAATLRRHRDEHDDVGEGLEELRAGLGDYEEQSPLCATHASLLGALSDLEKEIHQHVHEENNILFVRAGLG